MTDQEIYDSICIQAAAQGERSLGKSMITYNGKTMCRYRAKGGKKCFAGMLIKDEFYYVEFEGGSAANNEVEDALIKSGIRSVQIPLVVNLQAIHDNSENVEKLTFKLSECARENGLTPGKEQLITTWK